MGGADETGQRPATAAKRTRAGAPRAWAPGPWVLAGAAAVTVAAAVSAIALNTTMATETTAPGTDRSGSAPLSGAARFVGVDVTWVQICGELPEGVHGDPGPTQVDPCVRIDRPAEAQALASAVNTADPADGDRVYCLSVGLRNRLTFSNGDTVVVPTRCEPMRVDGKDYLVDSVVSGRVQRAWRERRVRTDVLVGPHVDVAEVCETGRPATGVDTGRRSCRVVTDPATVQALAAELNAGGEVADAAGRDCDGLQAGLDVRFSRQNPRATTPVTLSVPRVCGPVRVGDRVFAITGQARSDLVALLPGR